MSNYGDLASRSLLIIDPTMSWVLLVSWLLHMVAQVNKN